MAIPEELFEKVKPLADAKYDPKRDISERRAHIYSGLAAEELETIHDAMEKEYFMLTLHFLRDFRDGLLTSKKVRAAPSFMDKKITHFITPAVKAAALVLKRRLEELTEGTVSEEHVLPLQEICETKTPAKIFIKRSDLPKWLIRFKGLRGALLEYKRVHNNFCGNHEKIIKAFRHFSSTPNGKRTLAKMRRRKRRK